VASAKPLIRVRVLFWFLVRRAQVVAWQLFMQGAHPIAHGFAHGLFPDCFPDVSTLRTVCFLAAHSPFLGAHRPFPFHLPVFLCASLRLRAFASKNQRPTQKARPHPDASGLGGGSSDT